MQNEGGTGCRVHWKLLILFLLATTVPLSLWAAGPDTHLVKWNVGGTNSPPGLTNVIKIASGFFRDVVVRADGTVAQLGFGTPPPADLSNVVAVATGWAH